MHNTAPGRSIIYLSPRKRHISARSRPCSCCSRLAPCLKEQPHLRGFIWPSNVSALPHSALKVKLLLLVLPPRAGCCRWFEVLNLTGGKTGV